MAGATNPYAPPSAAERAESSEQPSFDEDEPHGWGFWLGLSLVGTIGIGLMTGYGVAARIYLAVTNSQHLQVNSLWLGFGLELVLCAALSGMATLAVVWMFRRDRRLPRLMQVFYAGQFVFYAMVAIAAAPGWEAQDTVMGSFGALVGRSLWFIRPILWMLYFGRSQRVKNTFVN